MAGNSRCSEQLARSLYEPQPRVIPTAPSRLHRMTRIVIGAKWGRPFDAIYK